MGDRSEMALSDVANEIIGQARARQTRRQRTALAFVLSKNYLMPFKVLAYSLVQSNSFVDCPIVIISDESVVFQDRFVRRICDVKKLVTEEQKQSFRSILSSKVRENYKLEWIAKYTFLKWLMYDDLGFDRLIYIDTDMIFTSCGEELLSYADGADFVCCPMFPLKQALEEEMANPDQAPAAVSAYPLNDDRYLAFLLAFMQRRFSIENARVNSGIQIVNSALLKKSFREKLVEIASSKAYPNEQSVLSDVFKRHDEWRIAFAPPQYNFKTSYIDRLTVTQTIHLMPQVKNLHYIGAAKPWLRPANDNTRITHLIWWKYAAEMYGYRKLFAMERGGIYAQVQHSVTERGGEYTLFEQPAHASHPVISP